MERRGSSPTVREGSSLPGLDADETRSSTKSSMDNTRGDVEARFNFNPSATRQMVVVELDFLSFTRCLLESLGLHKKVAHMYHRSRLPHIDHRRL